MENLFAYLVFASLVLLVIGFFSPNTSLIWYNKERTKKKSAIIYGLLFVASFVLFGVMSDINKSGNSSTADSSNTTTSTSAPELTQAQKDSIEIEKKRSAKPLPAKLTNEEYIKYYTTKFENIKLFKRWEQAPIYGEYADKINNVLLEMELQDSLFDIFKNQNIKLIYDKNMKIHDKALNDYLKYGDPDEDFFYFVNASCETALKSYLNDPDFEVVKDKYYLWQTKKGYDYKLQIRAKNRFGALILKEITFCLVYSPIDKYYSVTNIKE